MATRDEARALGASWVATGTHWGTGVAQVTHGAGGCTLEHGHNNDMAATKTGTGEHGGDRSAYAGESRGRRGRRGSQRGCRRRRSARGSAGSTAWRKTTRSAATRGGGRRGRRPGALRLHLRVLGDAREVGDDDHDDGEENWGKALRILELLLTVMVEHGRRQRRGKREMAVAAGENGARVARGGRGRTI